MSELCTICQHTAIPVEWHHTVPRSRGGENSLQIPLCSNCHRNLHFNALHLVSKINHPRVVRKNRRFWETVEDEDRAQTYLQTLVQALILPIPEELDRKHLLSINVTSEMFDQFKLLQMDLGLTSQDKTLEYCIKQALILRGLENVTTTKNVTTQVETRPWFM